MHTPAARMDPAPVETGPHTLQYIGPPGHVSDLFGPLQPGARYPVADATFARYLCRQHPDFWRVPPEVKE